MPAAIRSDASADERHFGFGILAEALSGMARCISNEEPS
jgi:hypothetical protein